MTSVEQPVTILPVPEPVKTEEAAATEAIIAGPGPVVPAKDENTPAAPVEEEKTTTTIKETEVKPSSPKGERKPFAVLNNLFHRKEKTATPTAEKEVAKEEAPVVEEAKKEPVVEAAPVAEAPVATESTEPTTAEVESPKKKDGFLDKLKHFVGDKKEKAPKRFKEPEEAKTGEAVKTEEPVVEAPVVESKPEAPVVADAPLATAETTETPVAAATTEEAPKEEETKKEEPAAKKDKTKIGRRLSARITGIFSSPRKEKSNPMEKTPTEEKKAEEALPAPVELPKTEEAKPDEPVAASSSTSEPIAAVEGPKSTEPVKAEEVKPEEPATTVTAVVSEEPKSEDRTPAIVS